MSENNEPIMPVMNTPQKIKYSDLLSQAVDAVTTERIFVPQNSTIFSPANVKEIRIPLAISADHFIDTQNSFLRFRIKNKASQAIQPDPHYGSCLFRRVRWEGSDGAILEDCNHYNLLNAVLYKFQVPNDHLPSAKIMNGVSATGTLKDGKSLAQNATFNVHTQLTSAFWNAHRYCPAGWVRGSNLTLSIELDSIQNCLYANGTSLAEYEVDQVELVCQTVYFNSQFNATFSAMLNSIGGIQYHSAGYTSIVNVVPAISNGEMNVNIPIRNMSVKSLLYVLQDVTQASDQKRFSLSGRVARKLKSFVQYIGGASYPLRKVTVGGSNQGHILSETLKAFNNLHNIHAGNTLIDGPGSGPAAASGESTADLANRQGETSINAYYPNDDSDNICSFLMAYEFENFSEDHMLSGLDMSSQNMPVNLRCEIDSGTATTLLTTFVHSDYIYTLTSDGVISVTN